LDYEAINNIAKSILVADGYSEPEIVSTTKAEGTNVWTVTAKSGEWQIDLLIDDNGGKLIDKEKTRHLVRVINETVQVSETVSASLGIYFELADPIAVPGTFTNANDIELEFDSENKNMLKAFTIKTKDTSNEEIIYAIHRASRFTNYLTFKTGLFVYHKQGRRVINRVIETTHVGFSIDAILTSLNDLDLTNQDLYNLISNSSKENQQLAHFASGQKALNDNNYDEAIREFFLVIENSGTTDETKYRPLRHAVSHERLDDESTVTNLNTTFNFNVSVGGYLDITDPQVDDILRQEARKIRDIAWHHINGIIHI